MGSLRVAVVADGHPERSPQRAKVARSIVSLVFFSRALVAGAALVLANGRVALTTVSVRTA